MKHKRAAALVIGVSLLLTACNKLTHYQVSEQEINRYLQKHNNFHKTLGVPGLLNADIVLSDLSSKIGRNEKDKIDLAGSGRLDISSLLGSQQADLKLTIRARPWYDPAQGAIYLKDLQLVDYTVSPAQLDASFKALTPYLEQSLRNYFDANPAYRLDGDRNHTEALAKKLAKGLEVKPGEIIIPFTQ